MIKIRKNQAKADCMRKSVVFLVTVAMMIGIVFGQLPGKIFAQEEKIFSIILPYYEGCIYNYEEIQSEKRDTGEIELFATAGTSITLSIETDKELDTVELRDDGNNTWMICQEENIVFQMPERNLRLFVKMKEVSEMESDAQTKETEMEAENKETELVEKEEEIRETEQSGLETKRDETEPETKKDETGQTETEKAGDKTEQTESGVEGKENEQIDPETEKKEAEQMESEMEGDDKGQTEPGKEGDETEQTEPGTEEDETGKVELKMEEDETRQIETQTEEVETGQIETQTEEDENGPMEAQTEEDENGPMETEAEGDETEQIETQTESEITSFEQETEQIASYYTMLAEAETAVPDTFKLICSEYPDYPHAPDNMQKSSLKLAMTSRKKVIFYEEDGTTTTRMAYCLQPAVNSPGSGDTYETNTAVEITDTTTKNRNLMKALYYLYGGPAWDKEIIYADGSGTANLKALLYNS